MSPFDPFRGGGGRQKGTMSPFLPFFLNESVPYLGRFKGEVAKLWNQAQQGQVKAENKSNVQIAPT